MDQIIILIISVVIHEVSHGLAAYALGDPTAKYAGRLTLNPIKHLDLLGSVLLPLFLFITNAGLIFGWAKPVPYNPYNLRSQKYGPAIVGLAGPLSNVVLALIAGIGLRIILVTGSDFFLLEEILNNFLSINVLLTVFNLFPVPPLDGSKLLFAIIPISEHNKMVIEQYSFLFFLIFISLFGSLISVVYLKALELFTDYIVLFNL